MSENRERKAGIKLVSEVLKHPPISYEHVVAYDGEGFSVRIYSPIGALAWKLLLCVLYEGSVVSRNEFAVCYELPLEKVYAYCQTTNWQEIRSAIVELAKCVYEIMYAKDGIKRHITFHILYASDSYFALREGKLRLYIDHSFESAREEGLWFYGVFAYFLRSYSALNLHAFLSGFSNISQVKEKTLLTKAKIFNKNESRARHTLQKALQELVSVGFLNGFNLIVKDGERYVELLRPSDLRARAMEKLQELRKRAQENLERLRQSWRESKRRQRKRKKDLSF